MEYINDATKFDREHANMIVDMVLNFFSTQRPSSKSEEYKPILNQFDTIINYKRDQVASLMDGKESFTLENVMMYLSCPLDVKTSDEISNFGIRTSEPPLTGRLNEYLARCIVKNAIILDGVPAFEDEVDTKPLQLITIEDMINLMASSMLPNRGLLIYMYMTGKGKEFTKLFGNDDLLKKIEAGKELTEKELMEGCPSEFLDTDHELDADYLRFLKNDLEIIKDGFKPVDKKEEYKAEEKVIPLTNRLSKGA